MSLKQTYAGQLAVLNLAYGAGLSSMKLRLFSNNHTVTDATILSDLTECSFTGYAAQSPSWTTPANVANVAQTQSGTRTFTYSGGSTTTVYGYYLTDSGGTVLLGAETFTSPVTLSTIIPSLLLAITYTQKTEF